MVRLLQPGMMICIVLVATILRKGVLDFNFLLSGWMESSAMFCG